MATTSTRSRDGLFKRGDSPFWWCWIAGRRRSTKCRDRAAARLKKAQLERAAADPAYLASHQATVGGAVADFLDDFQGRDRTAHTLKMYRVKCGHVVRVLGTDRKLAEVDATLVDSYISTRRGEGAKGTTIGKELTALRQVLRLAKRHKAFPFDIEEIMPEDFSAEYVPRDRALTWPEFEALVAALAKRRPVRAAQVVFSVAVSPRKSEAEKAHAGDIDWDAWTVHLRGTKTAQSDDTVGVAEPFRPMFWWYIRGLEGRLFGPWLNQTRDLEVACKRAGIDRVTANDLRRSGATLLRRAGVSLEAIARQLRHSGLAMANKVYAKLGPNDSARILTDQIRHADVFASENPGVQGRNRTSDTRIFNPRAEGQIAGSPVDRASPGSSVSPESGQSPNIYYTLPLEVRHFRLASWAWFRRAA